MKATYAAAALPVAATAIMIPSTNALPDLSTFGSAHTLTDPKSQLLKVDCPGCQLGINENGIVTWSHAIENALVLNISVGSAPETLELNGVRFYPPVMSLTSENPVPYIPQVPADMSLVQIKSQSEALREHALRLTSWAFQAGGSQTVSETGEELLTIHLQLNALERQQINVPDIAITTLKNSDGELAILNIETKDKKEVAKQECRDWPLLCAWREMLSDKLDLLGSLNLPSMPSMPSLPALPSFAETFGHGKPPCGKHMGPHRGNGGAGTHRFPGGMGSRFPPHKGARPYNTMPNAMDNKEDGAPWRSHGHGGKGPGGENGRRPGGHPHHHHHHHHKGQTTEWHRVVHTIARLTLTVVIPILLGIAVGMVTYLLGMAIGAVVAAIYLKIRGRNTNYQAVALVESEELVDDDEETPRCSLEKSEFKDEADEALPLYSEKEAC